MSIDEATPQDREGQHHDKRHPENARDLQEQNEQNVTTNNSKAAQQGNAGMEMEINEAEAEEILATLEAASEIKQTEAMLNTTSPLDKYTDADMPQILTDSPAGLLEGLEKEQARKWVLNTTGKVLARPFDTLVHFQPNHHIIAMNLINAACEITGSTEATVASPIKEKGDTGRHPITFLIHNLTQLEVHTLLSRSVWSSTEITFQVSPLMTMRPNQPMISHHFHH